MTRALGAVLALILALAGAFVAGWLGRGLYEANKDLVAVVKAEAKQEKATEKAAKEINEPSIKYEKRKIELSSSVQLADYRLRVPECKALPNNAGTTSEPNAEAEDRTGSDGAGAINLDETAREIAALGLDLKAANIQIEELQELVKRYKSSCTID